LLENYDYKKARQRVENILNSQVNVSQQSGMPRSDAVWTFDNGIKTWISAIFVDLRDSTTLFKNDDVMVAKIIRAFSSEVINIMNDSTLAREIGVRGDCVFGVFATPEVSNINEVCTVAFTINTYMKMLNVLLKKDNFPQIRAGIGVASYEDLAIKVGSKGTGIRDYVYIGRAMSEADRLSKVTNKYTSGFASTTQPIAISINTYREIINVDDQIKTLMAFDNNLNCYKGNVIIIDYNNWINGGMPQ